MSKNWPKISIITPLFNQVDFVERTIRSVIEQDYPNFEYIIKDAGSTDGSLEIAKDYAKRYPEIIKLVSKKDKGQADGINQGLELATGEILAYLNSDDTYAPETFKKVELFFQKNPRLMWVTGKCRIIGENDREIRSWISFYKNFWLRRYRYATLLILSYISQPATFWRRQAMGKVGYFNPNKHYTMDYDYWLRLGKHYRLGIIWEILANFRVQRASKSSTEFVEQFREDFETAKTHTHNSLILGFHQLSNWLIVFTYSILTFLNKITNYF